MSGSWRTWDGVPMRMRTVKAKTGARGVEMQIEAPITLQVWFGKKQILVWPDEVEEGLRQPGRKGYDQEFYKGIAEEYREILVSHPRAPTKELARRYGRTPGAVGRWLAQCRKLGLLTDG